MHIVCFGPERCKGATCCLVRTGVICITDEGVRVFYLLKIDQAELEEVGHWGMCSEKAVSYPSSWSYSLS